MTIVRNVNAPLRYSILGLRCFTGFPLVAASGGYSPLTVSGLLLAVASFLAEHGLWALGLQ